MEYKILPQAWLSRVPILLPRSISKSQTSFDSLVKPCNPIIAIEADFAFMVSSDIDRREVIAERISFTSTPSSMWDFNPNSASPASLAYKGPLLVRTDRAILFRAGRTLGQDSADILCRPYKARPISSEVNCPMLGCWRVLVLSGAGPFALACTTWEPIFDRIAVSTWRLSGCSPLIFLNPDIALEITFGDRTFSSIFFILSPRVDRSALISTLLSSILLNPFRAILKDIGSSTSFDSFIFNAKIASNVFTTVVLVSILLTPIRALPMHWEVIASGDFATFITRALSISITTALSLLIPCNPFRQLPIHTELNGSLQSIVFWVSTVRMFSTSGQSEFIFRNPNKRI